MTQMIRKQIYIQKRQDALVKRMAKARGVSEAEIIREAIDSKISGNLTRTPIADPDAFEQLRQRMLARRALSGAKAYQWNRGDAYEEREEKLGARHHTRRTSG